MSRLKESELKELAPAIFAQEPSSRVSDKYNFVPTIDLIKEIGKRQFFPVSAEQQATKDPINALYQKHVVRFRWVHDLDKDKKDVFEYILVNSHNARSSLRFYMGAHVQVCSNGLVFGTIEDSFRIVHIPEYDEMIESSIDEMFEKSLRTKQEIKDAKTIVLTEIEKDKFAREAHQLRYNKKSLVKPSNLLEIRRPENEKPTLWNVFNVLQENLIVGGVTYEMSNGTHKYPDTTTGLTNIDRKISINVALWDMMLKRLK